MSKYGDLIFISLNSAYLKFNVTIKLINYDHLEPIIKGYIKNYKVHRILLVIGEYCQHTTFCSAFR